MNSFTKNQNLSIYYAATPSRAKVGKQSQAFVSEKSKKFEVVKFDFKGWLSRLAKLEQIPTSLVAYFKIFIVQPGNQRTLRPYDTSDIVKINNIVNGFNHSIRRLNEDYPSIIENFHHVNREFIQRAERSFSHLEKGMRDIQE